MDEKKYQALYLIAIHLKKKVIVLMSKVKVIVNWFLKKSDSDLNSLLPYQFDSNLYKM